MAHTPSVEISRPRISLSTWIPVLLGLSVICIESTTLMGQGHTGQWMLDAINFFRPAHPVADTAAYEDLHHWFRKAGHLTGYGILGVLFTRAWFSVLRSRVTATWSRLRLYAAACGVLSVSAVAICDEIHQSFLPGRTATVSDVLIDTCGALLLNTACFLYLAGQRRQLLGQRRLLMYSARFTRVTLHRIRNRAIAAATQQAARIA